MSNWGQTHHGTDSAKGRMPSGYLWSASAYLAPCPYCGAPPFESCHVYGEPNKACQATHSGRSYLGHDLLRRALRLDSSTRDIGRLLDDEPPIPPPSEEDIVSLINRIVDERLAAKRAPARKVTPLKPRKRASS